MRRRFGLWRAMMFLTLVASVLCGTRVYANSMNVQSRTVDQIRERINNSTASVSDKVQYTEEPVTTAPYNPGKVSDATLNSALTILNDMRFIAGLDANVGLKDDYTKKAQAGMLIDCVNGKLSHTPSQPADMDDALYQLGYQGTSSSNIAWNYGTLGRSILGWVDDSDSSNISALGHRRWVLNPSMGYTGFGAVGAYTAMYSFDRSGSGSYTNVAWPAQNMPTAYFDSSQAWSLSTGRSESSASVKVTLTRENDGKVWSFSQASSDGVFYVNNGGYGMTGCVIFRPDGVGGYTAGDRFKVQIEGLRNGTLTYNVNFFDLIPVTDITVLKDPVAVEAGKEINLSSVAKAIPENASNTKLGWTVADTEIAEIESTSYAAYLKGLKAGNTTLTVSSADGTVKKTIPLHVHKFEYLSTENGLAHLRCENCGEEITGRVPTSFRYYWKMYGTSGYYWSNLPNPMDVGTTLDGMISNVDYSAESENTFSQMVAELDDSDAGEIRISGNHVYIDWKKAGTFTISLYPEYNPEAKRTYRAVVVKSVESLVLEAAPADTASYDSDITLTATPDGGKGILTYQFVMIDEDGKETILQDYDMNNTLTWKADRTGQVTFRAEVKDSGDMQEDGEGNTIPKVISSEPLKYTLNKAQSALAEGKSVLADTQLTYGQSVSELSFSEAVLGNTAFVNADTGKAVPGKVVLDDAEAILPAGTQLVSWTFTPDDENYEGAKGTCEIEVKKADPEIKTLPTPAAVIYHPNQTLAEIAIPDGEQSVPGTWAWAEDTTVPTVSVKTYAAVFTPEDTDNYNEAKADLALTVEKATPELATKEASAITYGQTLADSKLTVTAQIVRSGAEEKPVAVEGEASWEKPETAPAVVDSEKTEYTIRFVPTDVENYNEVTAAVRLKVNKAKAPSTVPGEKIELPYQSANVSDELLEDYPGWTFGEKNLQTEIPVGTDIELEVEYTAEDAENYETVTANVTIFRAPCEHEETLLQDEKDATCTEDGFSGDTFCAICGEKLSDGKVIPALGHQPEVIKAKAATCEEAGLTEGSRCSRCGEIYTEQAMVPALGHEFGAFRYVNANSHQRVCARDASHIETEAHTWDSGVVTKAATTTEAGTKTYTCTICGGTKQESIPMITPEVPADPESAPAAAEEEKQITNMSDNGESKSSTFGLLRANAKKIAKTSITLNWTHVKGASEYIVYGNRCGKKNKYEKIATISAPKRTYKVTRLGNKAKVKKGTFYKFVIVATAKASDGTEIAIATSKSIHIITKGNKKICNFKSVKLSSKKKLTLKVGKKSQIKAKQISENSKLKVKQHRKLCYESSNPAVAVVSKKGKITAKEKGKAKIYVYAQNGKYKIVNVTVK